MSMRLSQLRDSIHFTPFFSLTYLHTKYFQTRKKINPSGFNVNEIKLPPSISSMDEPFFSLPNKKIFGYSSRATEHQMKPPIKKYHLHIFTSFISLQYFEHIYFLLQSIIPFLNFGLELQ